MVGPDYALDCQTYGNDVWTRVRVFHSHDVGFTHVWVMVESWIQMVCKCYFVFDYAGARLRVV